MKRIVIALIFLMGWMCGVAQTAEKLYEKGMEAHEQNDYSSAINYFKLSNDSSSLYMLGLYYENGFACIKDDKIALNYYFKSAETGYAKAYHTLGMAYNYGYLGVAKNTNQAIEWYKKGIEKGNSSCMVGIGGVYLKLREYESCYKWYSRALDAGNTAALLPLARCYRSGYGVEKNYLRALEYYKQRLDMDANKLDYSPAYDIAQLYQEGGYGLDKNYRKAMDYYCIAQERYHNKNNIFWDLIAKSIGGIYYQGGYGVGQNIDSAFFYYDAAIWYMKKQNTAISTYDFQKYNELKSKCSDVARYSYLSSKSVDELRSEARTAYSNNRYSYAAELFENAATRSGEAVDQYNAALSYEMSNNSQKAYYWYEKAANQDYTDAQNKLPNALFNVAYNYHTSRNYTQAMAYYLKAWDQGVSVAANNIGVMYENGEGVTANNYTALSWYEKAKNAGDSQGSSNYYNLKQRMEAPQQTTTSSSSSTSSSGGNVFLDLLDATAKTMESINNVKNGTSSSSSGSYNSGSYSSSGSSNTGGSTTTSGNSSSTSTHIPSNAFCTEKVRLYQRYENRLLLMQREPDVHYNDTDRRNIQKDMRRIRNELISSGCNKNPYKSKMEDWDGTL